MLPLVEDPKSTGPSLGGIPKSYSAPPRVASEEKGKSNIYVLPIGNSGALNIYVQIFVWAFFFNSFEYIFWCGITGPYGLEFLLLVLVSI